MATKDTPMRILISAIFTGKKACRYGLLRDRTATVRTRIYTVHALFKSVVRLPEHTRIELLAALLIIAGHQYFIYVTKLR